MNTIRTRIMSLAAASAVVVSLGALGAGPAAAQSGVDAASRLAGAGTALVREDIGSPEVTFRATESPKTQDRQTAFPLPQGELFAGLAVLACISRPVRSRVRDLFARQQASTNRMP